MNAQAAFEAMGEGVTSQMGGFDAFYEDDQADTSIPEMQKITRGNNTLPHWGDKATMNINHLVLQNIVSSPYFKTTLNEVENFQQLINEIYYNVTHLEPWERGTRKLTGMTGMCGQVRGVGAGGIVSTSYCLLYKLFCMKITRRQLVSMINYHDACYIRGLGFLFIRYCQPPADLWAWYEPYMDDEELIDPKAGGGDSMTIGQMVKTLLQKLDWYDTLFPRIPVPIQKSIDQSFQELRKRTNKAAQEAKRWTDSQRAEEQPLEKEERAHSRERDRDRRSHSRSRKRSPTSKSSSKGHRPGHRCAHHSRHHHCIKHKLRCPRKATNKRKDVNGDKEKEKDKERERDTKETRDKERRSTRSRSPANKRSRRSRSRERSKDRDRRRDRR